jgi:hypothetical protein
MAKIENFLKQNIYPNQFILELYAYIEKLLETKNDYKINKKCVVKIYY